MDKARRLAKEAGAAAAEAGARAAHKAEKKLASATEKATAVALTKTAATKQRAEAYYRGTDDLVDPHLQQKQAALKALGVGFSELCRQLRHERKRALESAEGSKETRDALTRLVEASHALRPRLQPAITSEDGLAARWEQLAGAILRRKQGGSAFGQLALPRLLSAPDHASGCPKLRPASGNQPAGPRLVSIALCFDTGAIDAQLLGPAAVQLTAVFAEAEKVHAACVAINTLTRTRTLTRT